MGTNELILLPYLSIKFHLYVACVFLCLQCLTSAKHKVLECSGLCNSGRFWNVVLVGFLIKKRSWDYFRQGQVISIH